MRPLKMLGLAAIVTVAVTALIGTGSAPAEVTKTRPCLAFLQLCTQLYLIGNGKLLANPIARNRLLQRALAKNPIAEGNVNEKCNSSELSYEEEYEEGSIEVEQTPAWTFTGECKPCSSAKVNSLPHKAELVATSEGNGELITALNITLSSCPFGITCTFESKAVKLSVIGSETEPKIIAEKEPLSFVSGSKAFCGETATLSATYVVNGIVEDLLSSGGVIITEHMWQTIYISPEFQR